jgi:very-short-patch-repair endonuclease
MKKHPPGIATVHARELRRNATPAELRMWRLLRERLSEGRWRRQVPIRHYIADFASHRFRLVIELDGGQHTEARDAARSAAIEHEGYRIIRFWNNELRDNAEGCLARLLELIGQAHPHPTATRRSAKSPYPSPIEGEGSR